MLATTSVDIDKTAAYVKGHPIRMPGDMPKELTWNPISREWLDSLWDRWWCTDYQGCCLPDRHHRIFVLRDKLLTFGGDQACMPGVEEDLQDILNRGQLWYGDRITFMKGEIGQCHANSAALWEANKSQVMLATGYALALDGMWRQHSWCIWIKPRKNRVVETTVKMQAYFGFVMTREETEEFWENNF